MSEKKTLFLDSDFINDLFGRQNFDQDTGKKILDSLAEEYDLHTTSTVLDEIQPQHPNAKPRRQWFDENADKFQNHNTDAYSDLPGQSNAGERSIASVIDPDYVDPDLGATTNHDPNLPSLNDTDNLQIATRDTDLNPQNTRPTQSILEDALTKGDIDPPTYQKFYDNNNGQLGTDPVKTPQQAVVDKLNEADYSAYIDDDGNVNFDGKTVSSLDDFLRKAGVVGNVLGLALVAQEAQAQVDDGDYNGAAETILEAVGGGLGAVAGGAAAAALLAAALPALGVGAAIGAVAVGVGAFLGSILGDAAGQALVGELLEGAKGLGILPDLNDFELPEFGLPELPGIGDIVPPWVGDLLEPIFGIPGFEFVPGGAVGGGLDPLVFDLDGSGTIDLVSVENSTARFDFWNDGFAEKTGWVAASDGMLVVDLDQSGDINGAAELFGSNFPLTYIIEDDFGAFQNDNGFARLEQYDSNDDGVIDSLDDIWSELRIWQDLNQDGVSQSSELLTLDNIGIASIDVANYALDSFVGMANGGFTRIIEGHTITHSGTYTMADGTVREIADVWFNNSLQDSVYQESVDVDVRTFFLPDVRGYGLMPNLFVAMSHDNETGGLLDDVADFVTARTFEQMFSEFGDVRSEVSDILFKWAGVHQAELSYQRHGLLEEMPEYAFLRSLAGQDAEYLGTWFDGTPFLPIVGDGVESIYQSWNMALDGYVARLIFQSGGADLFVSGVSYDSVADVFVGDLRLSQTAVEALRSEATGHQDVEGFWHNLAVFLDNTIGIDQLASDEISWLSDAVDVSSVGALTWSDIVSTLDENIIDGTAGDDTMTGSQYDDVINSGTGDDIIYGGDGNDRINANFSSFEDDSDTLIGGAGNDILLGGRGNDTYVYESGHDVIVEQGGNFAGDTDIIVMDNGIDVSDVSLHLARIDSGNTTEHFFLKVEGRGTITIQNDTAWWSSLGDLVDEVHFEDGTVLQIPAMDVALHGTDDDDMINTLYGFTDPVMTVYGYGGNDHISQNGNHAAIIDGGDGDDVIISNGHDDVFIFSAGTDIINDAGGYDVIRVPEGYTIDDLDLIRTEVGGVYGSHDDAALIINGLGTVHLHNYFVEYSGANDRVIEVVEFADGTVVDLSQQVFEVVGSSGDDIIGDFVGGVGHPVLDSVYVWGQGNDVIHESLGGVDTVRFGEGIVFSDLTLSVYQGDIASPVHRSGLLIEDANGNSMLFHRHFEYSNSTTQEANRSIEKLEFSDGTIVNLSDIEVNVYGSEHNDQLVGAQTGDASDADVIYAYGGNDSVFADYGDDTVYGGGGDDYIQGHYGDDVLYGDSGNDTIHGMHGNDNVVGGAGNDILYGDGVYSDAMGDDVLSGGDGDDVLHGGKGNDTYIYTSGNDLIDSENYDSIDVVILPEGIAAGDLYFWRDGNSTSVQQSLKIDVGSLGTITLRNQVNGNYEDYNMGIETLQFHDGSTLNLRDVSVTTIGSAGNDYLRGIQGSASIDDTLEGFDGNDVLTGYEGNDILKGGSGHDTLYGGIGNDTYYFTAGLDEISDSAGNDLIVLPVGVSAGDIRVLNAGDDDILINVNTAGVAGHIFIHSYRSASGNNVIEQLQLADGSVIAITGDNASNEIYGSFGGDGSLMGDQGGIQDDMIYGLTGNDTLYGYGGNDVLYGGEGDDVLHGGEGDDVYYYTSGVDDIWDAGGAGDKIVLPEGVTAGDIIMANVGNADIQINIVGNHSGTIILHNQTLSSGINSIETLELYDGTVLSISASNSSTELYGTAAADNISGDQGGVSDDVIHGLSGADSLYGYAGADTLNGGTGNDNLNGGTGDDIFEWSVGDGDDVIGDTDGFDIIKLHGVLESDVTFEQYSSFGLRIHVGAETLTLNSQFQSDYYSSNAYDAYRVEEIHLDDGTVIDLLGGLAFTGTSAGETVNGTGSDDYLFGEGGDDTLYAKAGDDVLNGGTGNDNLNGGTGD
ncbi:MAG: calcium-binding protein, partial [Alphaproteobacteria bacterium]